MATDGAEDGEHPSEADFAVWLGGSDCQEAIQTLYGFLDGELTQERRKVIQRLARRLGGSLRQLGGHQAQG